MGAVFSFLGHFSRESEKWRWFLGLFLVGILAWYLAFLKGEI
jgi:hypothetical protein